VSRFFRNPLYLDVTRVPELRRSAEARRLLASPAVRDEARRLRGTERLDPERVASLQRRLIVPLHRAFRATEGGRARAFRRYRDGHELLEDFATFQALEEHLTAAGHPADWRRWPRELRAPDSAGVAAFRHAHQDVVDLHAYVQFELDRQLARTATAAHRAGLAIGLYQDLALSSLASGFDAWRFPDRFVSGASLGAPPDLYAREGQDWGLPPLHPRHISRDGFEIWRGLLRTAFAHAGALRIDHILGLFRQWWVPAGRPASEGAYVRFPSGALLTVLAEESRRHRALVIGEDLGTVPPQVAPTLARFGVLSSRVLLFERDRAGRFRTARRWSPRALATANTHDLTPLPGYLCGSDIDLRRSLGLIDEGAELARTRRERSIERRALLQRLVADGHLAPGRDPSTAEVVRAVHAFLCATPCPLVGLSLDDLAGETEPVNVPGVPMERHPSWTRRMRVAVEDLASDPGVRSGLAGAARRERRS
jgi:4-alpha-glucanotransferase